MYSRLIITLVVLLISCNLNGNNKSVENIERKNYCSISEFESFIDNNSSINISIKFKKLLKSNNDSCTLIFLGVIVNNYLNKPNTKSFQDLNQISCSFDGYISEAFIDYMPKLVENRSTLFFDHLFTESKKVNIMCLDEFTLHYIQVYDVDNTFKNAVKNARRKSKNKDFISYLAKFER